MYDNFNRVPAERVEAGDICAFTGLGDVGIGETVCARDSPIALPTIEVSQPCLGLQAATLEKLSSLPAGVLYMLHCWREIEGVDWSCML